MFMGMGKWKTFKYYASPYTDRLVPVPRQAPLDFTYKITSIKIKSKKKINCELQIKQNISFKLKLIYYLSVTYFK